MSDPDMELMEQELNRLKPSAPPRQLLTRLETLGTDVLGRKRANLVPMLGWRAVLRWLIPAAALPALTLAGLWLIREPAKPLSAPVSTAARQQVATGAEPETALSAATLSPEQVHIDYRLLAAFETVAEVPGRGPVRFRCSEWEDRVVVRDPNRGVAVERRTPRFEIVPVRYESY